MQIRRWRITQGFISSNYIRKIINKTHDIPYHENNYVPVLEFLLTKTCAKVSYCLLINFNTFSRLLDEV